ncbi:hypothetical protein LXL04_029792 [Taraxacum kok-saghyz]
MDNNQVFIPLANKTSNSHYPKHENYHLGHMAQNNETHAVVGLQVLDTNGSLSEMVLFVFCQKSFLTTYVCAVQTTRRRFASQTVCFLEDRRPEKCANVKNKQENNSTNSLQTLKTNSLLLADCRRLDVWSTSSAAEGCRCGPQTADGIPVINQLNGDYTNWKVIARFNSWTAEVVWDSRIDCSSSIIMSLSSMRMSVSVLTPALHSRLVLNKASIRSLPTETAFCFLFCAAVLPTTTEKQHEGLQFSSLELVFVYEISADYEVPEMAVVNEVILKHNFWSIFEDDEISFAESSWCLSSDFFIILIGSTYAPLISE